MLAQWYEDYKDRGLMIVTLIVETLEEPCELEEKVQESLKELPLKRPQSRRRSPHRRESPSSRQRHSERGSDVRPATP